MATTSFTVGKKLLTISNETHESHDRFHLSPLKSLVDTQLSATEQELIPASQLNCCLPFLYINLLEARKGKNLS